MQSPASGGATFGPNGCAFQVPPAWLDVLPMLVGVAQVRYRPSCPGRSGQQIGGEPLLGAGLGCTEDSAGEDATGDETGGGDVGEGDAETMDDSGGDAGLLATLVTETEVTLMDSSDDGLGDGELDDTLLVEVLGSDDGDMGTQQASVVTSRGSLPWGPSCSPLTRPRTIPRGTAIPFGSTM